MADARPILLRLGRRAGSDFSNNDAILRWQANLNLIVGIRQAGADHELHRDVYVCAEVEDVARPITEIDGLLHFRLEKIARARGCDACAHELQAMRADYENAG